ncbi:MAG: AAC(3) family N-acetyltransferase [Trueperaceae bacterium]
MTQVSSPLVTKEMILSGLRQVGVDAEMKLMVHSSLSSFGRVEGGPVTVIDALLEVLTPAGVLLMPSFNHGAPFGEGGAGIYDPATTPTTNGVIADTFWRMPAVYRSLNPTHPFAAWGGGSSRFVNGHHRTLTMGEDSPLGLLLQAGGYGLLMGVGYEVNTFHHVVEVVTGAPCLGKRTEEYPVRMPDGSIAPVRTWGWRERSCPLTGDGRYGEEMRRQGLERTAKVGECKFTLFRLRDCFKVVANLLQEGRNENPPCVRCPIRPRVVTTTVPSDWED